MGSFGRGLSLSLPAPILQTTLDGRRPDRQGKVRDLYDFGDRLLLVATDRISAFDYVLGSGIPDKGKVLSQISAFWFARTARRGCQSRRVDRSRRLPGKWHDAQPRSCAGDRCWWNEPSRCRSSASLAAISPARAGRTTCRRARSAAFVCPPGLRESDRLPHPIFTPATKAQSGHDINIGEAEAAALVGAEVFAGVRDLTLRLYEEGAAHAESLRHHRRRHEVRVRAAAGDGRRRRSLILIDEVLTPDSSRFWPQRRLRARRRAAQFRQTVRPRLPRAHPLEQAAARAVAARRRREKTREKYVEAFRRLTGRELA